MKYKKVNFKHAISKKYYEDDKDSLNSYTKKIKCIFSSGEFYIYIDADKIEYGKEKT